MPLTGDPIPPDSLKHRKQGRPPKASESYRDWNDYEVLHLCHLWQSYESLYNTNHKDYFIPKIRWKCLQSMIAELNYVGIKVTEKQLVKKLTDLKNYYGSQKRMIERSKSSGTDNVYSSCWKFFEALHFLNDAFAHRLMRKKVDTSERKTNPPSPEPTGRMKENEIVEQISIVSTSSASSLEIPVFESHRDRGDLGLKNEDDCFCDLIKQMLGQIPNSDLKDDLRLEIQQLILRYKKQIHHQISKITIKNEDLD